MADATKIEWTDATWNPITGCSVVSPGCTHCYAMKLAGTRLQHHPSRAGLTRETKAGPVWNGTVRFNEEWLSQPLHWKRSRMVFVCAHGDLGHPDIPTKWLDRVFAVMMLARRHTYQVLTKRPERLREYLTDPSTPGRIARMAVSIMADGIFVAPLDAAQITYAPDPGWQFGQKPVGLAQWPLPNVWLGTSVEDQERADQRVPELLATPAAVHFVSAEPLLGPIDFSRLKLTAADSAGNPINIIDPLDAFTGMTWTTLRSGAHAGKRFYSGSTGGRGTLDWIIVGGESGQGARPMHPDWPRHIRDQCAAAGTAFFFKQWGEWSPAAIERRGTGLHDNEVRLHADGRQNGDGGIRTGGITLRRAGKKAAGRLLDGVEHNAIPRAA